MVRQLLAPRAARSMTRTCPPARWTGRARRAPPRWPLAPGWPAACWGQCWAGPAGRCRLHPRTWACALDSCRLSCCTCCWVTAGASGWGWESSAPVSAGAGAGSPLGMAAGGAALSGCPWPVLPCRLASAASCCCGEVLPGSPALAGVDPCEAGLWLCPALLPALLRALMLPDSASAGCCACRGGSSALASPSATAWSDSAGWLCARCDAVCTIGALPMLRPQ